MSGKIYILLQDFLPRCWEFRWKHGSLFEWSYSKKHWNIKMLFQFVMDVNKLLIYLLKCWYFELGLLFKPLQIHSFLLWNFMSWIKVLVIGCCQMYIILLSPYALPWKLIMAKFQALNQSLIHEDFDLELQKFKLRMMMQVINILSPFLAFVLAYNQAKAHNMLAIMFDP